MAYIRTDAALMEKGVAVDMLNDGSLFVMVRANRSKTVEAERTRQQAPYRNIVLSGRPLPPGVAKQIGHKITANAIIAGAAGVLPNGVPVGKVENGQPVEFAKVEGADMVRILEEYPDFEDDVNNAAAATATFAAVTAPAEPAVHVPEAPTLSEAATAAAGN